MSEEMGSKSLTKQFGFPGGLGGKESTCSAGDMGSVPGLGRSPGEGNGCPLQLFFPGESCGWRSQELDVTKQVMFPLFYSQALRSLPQLQPAGSGLSPNG